MELKGWKTVPNAGPGKICWSNLRYLPVLNPASFGWNVLFNILQSGPIDASISTSSPLNIGLFIISNLYQVLHVSAYPAKSFTANSVLINAFDSDFTFTRMQSVLGERSIKFSKRKAFIPFCLACFQASASTSIKWSCPPPWWVVVEDQRLSPLLQLIRRPQRQPQPPLPPWPDRSTPTPHSQF